MRKGTPKGEFGAVVPRMAPKVDVTINCTTEVNAARAAQSGSIATRTEAKEPPPSGIKPLSPAGVKATRRRRGKDKTPPDVDLSLFVQISQDLAPDARRAVREQIDKLSVRARWKLDTAVVEVAGPKVRELHAVEAVSYMEPGQTLRGPEPIVGGDGKAPGPRLRRVSAQGRRHRDGRGVLVGIIDIGGFDFAHEDFLDGDGNTRWEAIWDQGGSTRPHPFGRRGDDKFKSLDYGSEIQKADMDRAIAAARERRMAATSLEPQSVMQVGSHGTHVASIAAGNLGVARQAHLAGVLVALRPEDTNVASSFYDSTRIAHAVDYLLALAAKLGGDDGPMPVAINVSLGTNGHAHDTSSAMARWIDNALSTPARSVTVAAGNAGQVEPAVPPDGRPVTGRIHAAGSFAGTGLRHVLRWVVGGGEVADVSENEMEIWYGAQDRISVEVRPPGGTWIGPVEPGGNLRNVMLDNGTVLNVHSETYYPANGANRIWIVLAPFYGDETEDGRREIGPIAPGEWEVRLTGTVIRNGRYDAWIERDDARRVPGPGGRSWRYPSTFAPGSYTDDRMISSLACAERILSVGNVDVARSVAHVTSSRGPTRDGRFKPDVGADGTDVVAARGFDRRRPWIAMTGTSMASPYVCGVTALMLAVERSLTAAQIQGIVISTSQPLPGHSFSWRKDTGFGVIDPDACLEEAIALSQARRP